MKTVFVFFLAICSFVFTSLCEATIIRTLCGVTYKFSSSQGKWSDGKIVDAIRFLKSKKIKLNGGVLRTLATDEKLTLELSKYLKFYATTGTLETAARENERFQGLRNAILEAGFNPLQEYSVIHWKEIPEEFIEVLRLADELDISIDTPSFRGENADKTCGAITKKVVGVEVSARSILAHIESKYGSFTDALFAAGIPLSRHVRFHKWDEPKVLKYLKFLYDNGFFAERRSLNGNQEMIPEIFEEFGENITGDMLSAAIARHVGNLREGLKRIGADPDLAIHRRYPKLSRENQIKIVQILFKQNLLANFSAFRRADREIELQAYLHDWDPRNGKTISFAAFAKNAARTFGGWINFLGESGIDSGPFYRSRKNQEPSDQRTITSFHLQEGVERVQFLGSTKGNSETLVIVNESLDRIHLQLKLKMSGRELKLARNILHILTLTNKPLSVDETGQILQDAFDIKVGIYELQKVFKKIGDLALDQ